MWSIAAADLRQCGVRSVIRHNNNHTRRSTIPHRPSLHRSRCPKTQRLPITLRRSRRSRAPTQLRRPILLLIIRPKTQRIPIALCRRNIDRPLTQILHPISLRSRRPKANHLRRTLRLSRHRCSRHRWNDRPPRQPHHQKPSSQKLPHHTVSQS